jgi:hypothetical protein
MSVTQEAIMTSHYPDSRNRKALVRLAIFGMAVVILMISLDRVAAHGCHLLNETAWVAIELLRPFLLAGWHSVPASLREDSRFFENLLQIVGSNWRLLCVMGG